MNHIEQIKKCTNCSLYEVFVLAVLVDSGRIDDAIDALAEFHQPLEILDNGGRR